MTNLRATRCRRQGDVAEIQLVNPPVNGLGHEVRQSLHAHLRDAIADTQVRAIVLSGAGDMFCGGADIRQFNTPKATAQPMLRDINRLIERSGKPVIAAIHGNALGGGLELAMSCHYRLAVAGVRLALPEVKLGILPGGGGTQRLPRLIGLEKALAMIVSGEAVDANEALERGLIDQVVTGELLDAALSWASALAKQDASSLPVTSARQVRFDGEAAAYFKLQKVHLAQVYRGYPAPLECLACLEASLTMPFEEALTFERARVQHLVDGPESKALRYLFFAEREARRMISCWQTAETPSGTPVDARRIVERMMSAYQSEALLLWLEGAAPTQVNRALQSFGFAHGCFATLNLSELEAQLTTKERPLHVAHLDAVRELLRGLRQQLVDSGFPESGMASVGIKDSAAFVSALATRYRLGQRDAWSDSEIVDRLLCAAVKEYVELVGNAGDLAPAVIDWFWVRHHGFPAWRGGPIHYLAAHPTTTIPLPLPRYAPA